MSSINISPMNMYFLMVVTTNAVKCIKVGMDARKLLELLALNIDLRGCEQIDLDKSAKVKELVLSAAQFSSKGMGDEAIEELKNIGLVFNADGAKIGRIRRVVLREEDGALSALPYDLREEIYYRSVTSL
eukprot:gene28865-32055_t